MGYIRGMKIKHCSIKKLDSEPDMVAHAVSSALGRWRQENQVFTATLSFIASVKVARII